MINELIIDDMIEYIINLISNEEQQEIEYNKLEQYVINKAILVKSKLKYKNGVYYPLQELRILINENNNNIECFILDQLKMHGIEYYKKELYRVTD